MVNESERRYLKSLSRDHLDQYQLDRLNALLADILPANSFYARKFADVPAELTSLEQLTQLPFTTKQELQTGDDHHAANRTDPAEQYVRYHQTSGTHGRPMIVTDTAADWQWWIDTWQYVLDAAHVSADDRALLAFSFGPFIGFWSAHDALAARGAMTIPAGGMSTVERLELARRSQATVLFATPTYALRLAEVADENRFDLGALPVERIVVAGEPGGSLPAVRTQIENHWNAQVIDHAGATEVGPWGVADAEHRGLHVIESEFIAEFESIDTGLPAAEGELSHLVLTTLGRRGAPLIRYRTGDLVRPKFSEHGFVLLDGGVIGRADDMVIIRGVNVFPSSIEQIVRGFADVIEYRLTARRDGALDTLALEVEDRGNQPARIADQLRRQLGLNVDVQAVPLGSLPRFEGKGRRFVDQRS